MWERETSITSYVSTQEGYTFGISPGQQLYTPSGSPYPLTAGALVSVAATGLGYQWDFSYEVPSGAAAPLGDGGLTQVQFPQGGSLQWAYTPFWYVKNRQMWEVSTRYLQSTNGGPLNTYTLSTPDPSNGTVTVHSARTLSDPTGAQKVWSFDSNTADFNVGLVSELQELAQTGSVPRDSTYTWALDCGTNCAGNPYISRRITTLDKGQNWTQSTTTNQTMDTYGNVLAMTMFDYNGASSRTYTNTYAHTSAAYPKYPQYYLFNRLLTSTLTSAGTNVTLVSNIYDGNYGSSIYAPSPTMREQDWQNYGSTFFTRGNVTQTNTPGRTVNTYYDTTGTVIEQDDNNGHYVSATTTSNTNYTLPEQLIPNGTGSLQTQASYDPVSYAPNSVASPLQSLYNPQTGGSAPYTHYDSYGRVD